MGSGDDRLTFRVRHFGWGNPTGADQLNGDKLGGYFLLGRHPLSVSGQEAGNGAAGVRRRWSRRTSMKNLLGGEAALWSGKRGGAGAGY